MDEKNFEMIWKQYHKEIKKHIDAKVGHIHDAQDLFQKVFIKVYQNIHQLPYKENHRAWLYAITNHTIIDHYRKNKKEVCFSDDSKDPENVFENINMNDELAQCVGPFMDGLPNKYREPLQMYAFERMSHAQIADQLSISEGCAKVRLHRGKEKLKKCLDECCHIQTDVYGNIVDYQKK